MIVTTKKLFSAAYGKNAIGAYNINNLEQAMGLFRGCLDSSAPFISQISKGARSYTHNKGLNLTEATLLGLQKHSRPEGNSHTMESQVVNVCDEIAYNNHDLDDGIESEYLSSEELLALDIWKKAVDHANAAYPGGKRKILVRHAIRWMINYMVSDLIDQTKRNITPISGSTPGRMF